MTHWKILRKKRILLSSRTNRRGDLEDPFRTLENYSDKILNGSRIFSMFGFS